MNQKKARVIYSYSPQNVDELELKIDDIIDVLDIVEEGWWRGKLRGKVGVFPSNFVVDVDVDSGINSDHQHHSLTTMSRSEELPSSLSTRSNGDFVTTSGAVNVVVVDGCVSSKSAIVKNNIKSGESESLPPTSSSPDFDNVIKPKQIIGIPTPIRLSGNIKPNLKPVDDKSPKNPPKKPPPPTPAEMDAAPRLPPKPLREQAKVLFAYEAQNDDELTIKEGDIINILSKEIEDQGWWKGELNGKVGVFPDNFVELIKVSGGNEDIPTRSKKPERPSEKPPLLPNTALLTKSPSSPKVNEPHNKAPIAPVVPGKKPKLSPGPTKNSATIIHHKPDVVPQESPIKSADNLNDSNHHINNEHNNTENQFGSFEHANKLNHLTADRPKGPKDRRPPSLVHTSKELEDAKENGDLKPDIPKLANNNNNISCPSPQPESNKSAPIGSGSSVQAPWMTELRRKQEVTRNNINVSEDAPNSPTKTSPIRFSGEWKVKPVGSEIPDYQADNAGTDSIGISSNGKSAAPSPNILSASPVSILKPIKAAKPTNFSPSNILGSTTKPGTKPVQHSDSLTNLNITTTSASTISANSAHSVFNSNVGSNGLHNNSMKELGELQKEIQLIKETMVPKKDFDDLVKQVNELKDQMETQKQSHKSLIKDLINDVAEERKKTATLQIEVDRLRKLTTTV